MSPPTDAKHAEVVGSVCIIVVAAFLGLLVLADLGIVVGKTCRRSVQHSSEVDTKPFGGGPRNRTVVLAW